MQNNSTDPQEVLGLDIGNVRIGIARANTLARLPEPLMIIDKTKQDVTAELKKLVNTYNIVKLIIGLPKLASGQDSEQTTIARTDAIAISNALGLTYEFVDESYTSKEADEYIKAHNSKNSYNDAIAACVILERYFSENIESSVR